MANDGSVFDIKIPFSRGTIRFVFSNRGDLDHIASFIRENGLLSYETPTPSIFVCLAERGSGSALDIGANTGIFSLLAAAANPDLHVHAFEPLESVRDLLHANIAHNPDLAPRSAVQPCALSRVNGSSTFFETINDQGLVTTSSSLELDHARQAGEYRRVTVVTRTLDSWAKVVKPASVALLKIDVEGHEDAVIEGGRNTISRHRPFIIVEILGPSRVEVLDRMLLENDYLDFALAPAALRHYSRVRFHADAWNHLLCPVEKIQQIVALCGQLNLDLQFP